MQNKYFKFLIIILVVVIVVPQITLTAWWNPFSWNWGWVSRVFNFQQIEQNKDVVCAQDAKQCPDGSYVSRQGSKCEFKQCPEAKVKDPTVGWKTYTNTQYGFELKYPANFKTTADINPAGYLNLYLGHNNALYVGDINIQVIKNDKNETAVQYFVREKNNAIQGFGSKCQTCVNMDVDAGLYNCLASNSALIKIASEEGFLCQNMPQRATAPSPVYVFNGGYIYMFLNYDKNNPVYETYKQILSTFKFMK